MSRFAFRLPFSVIVLAGMCHGVKADPRPNFLFVYTDDQRWDAMSSVQRAQGEQARFPWIRTPNMDRLAAEGVCFRNAFVVNSLCAPSRASLLTGCYGYLNGVVNNHTEFPVGNVTYATELRKAGYVTGYVGKWHMGRQSGQRPGFDFSASFVGQGRYFDCPFEINGKSTETTGWVDDVSTDFALKFLRENKARPFLLALGFKSPHGPRTPAPRWANAYAEERARTVPNLSVPAIYLGSPDYGKAEPTPPGLTERTDLNYHRCIRGADENLGKLLDELDKLGLADNTLVIFTSDNGYYLGEHRLGDKRSAYEESLRVPMLVRFPKLGAKGKLVDTTVLNIDIAPTILDYAGVAVPAQMQGRSWRPLLEGDGAGWRQQFFYCYYFERGFRTPTTTAVRNGLAKLVKYPGHEEWTELFDLQADRYEMKNLIADPAHAELRKQMEADYQEQARAIGFQIPPFADDPAGSTPAAPPGKACVLDYRFDQDQGDKATDHSGKENHASARGAPLVAGRDGHKARRFDGTALIDVGKAKSLSPCTPGWTVSVTFKADKPDGILLTHGGASQGYCLYLRGGKPAWAVRSSRRIATVAGAEPVGTGWNTLTATITADKHLVLLCNGKCIAKGKLHDFITKDPNQGLRIGANRGSQVVSDYLLPGFAGLIESVQIFNYERP
jgi:arylsulfatase A-like enzyme